jgi:hypothetical protein
MSVETVEGDKGRDRCEFRLSLSLLPGRSSALPSRKPTHRRTNPEAIERLPGDKADRLMTSVALDIAAVLARHQSLSFPW